MNMTATISAIRDPSHWDMAVPAGAMNAAYLPAIALARSTDDLWHEMLGFCRRAHCPDMCFIDMIGGGRGAAVVASSFTPHFCPEALREDLCRSGSATMIDERTLALPAFGPQGLEAALVVTLDLAGQGGGEWARCLGMAFQLAYARYRQLRPLARGGDIPLSEREREIMQWVTRGKSNAVIATILGISASTVDTYMRRIFRKLEVADRTSAAMRAMAIGAIAA